MAVLYGDAAQWFCIRTARFVHHGDRVRVQAEVTCPDELSFRMLTFTSALETPYGASKLRTYASDLDARLPCPSNEYTGERLA